LIASHIKPWAVASDKEKLDSKNGFILSPLYDKLFDRGFITFTEDRKIVLSNWISPANKKRLGVVDGQFVQMLPLDDARQEYMKFHRSSVFKG
ncbi:MAG: HNH endonuclease, partial [Muribaculaceae bacterium]